MSNPIFIAVHVGAERVKNAMAILKQQGRAIDAVTEAIRTLEDDPVTNAGYGSNLTLHGTVECDASIMSGKNGTFGAVGAVSSVKNPIRTARQMVLEADQGLLSLGRIPPMLLTGDGAKQWTKQRGLPLVDDNDLIAPQAQEVFLDHIQRLVEDQKVDQGHDTVGAICIDCNGEIIAGVSSGGISLKAPGRVGEAAMYGSGCWAQNEKDNIPGIACSTTGTGEQIMRTMFTYKCAERLSREDDMQTAVNDALQLDFLESPLLSIYNEKSVGIIALRSQTYNERTRLEFWYGHVTNDMGIGYMSGTYKKPKTFVSRKTSPHDTMVSSGWLIP